MNIKTGKRKDAAEKTGGYQMSIVVNTNRNTGVKQITIKRPDGSDVGTITIHSNSLKKLKAGKPLPQKSFGSLELGN